MIVIQYSFLYFFSSTTLLVFLGRPEYFFFNLKIGIKYQNNLQHGFPILKNVLTSIIKYQDKNQNSNMSIVISFCKNSGEEYIGLHPLHIVQLAKRYNVELPKSSFIPDDKQQAFRCLFKEYYDTLTKHLLNEFKELKLAERSKKRQIEARGELQNEHRERLEALHANYEKMLSAVSTLSDLLGEEIPSLVNDAETVTETSTKEDDEMSNLQLDQWGDEETKMFYTDLPDIRSILPNYCHSKIDPILPSEKAIEDILDADDADDVEISLMDFTESPEIQSENLEENVQSLTIVPQQLESKQSFERFLQNLTNCVNKGKLKYCVCELFQNIFIFCFRKLRCSRNRIFVELQ